MTMAHWVTVVMSGLSGTKHLEMETPPDMSTAGRGRLPDLWGWHAGEDMNWVIEAKAGRHIGGPHGQLASGWEQLDAGSARMGAVRHRKVLCGTSLPDRTNWQTEPLTMAVRTEMVVGAASRSGPSAPSTRERDEAAMREAVALVGRELLVYLTLVHGPVEELRIERPAVAFGDARPDGTLYFEHEWRGGAPLVNHHEFLVARLPGTNVNVGMSQRLVAACQVWVESRYGLEESWARWDLDGVPYGLHPGDEAERGNIAWLVRRYRDARHRVLDAYRDPAPWSQLIEQRVEEGAPGRSRRSEPLEHVTSDTYVATDGVDPIVFAH
jgi:hypothetical protein